MGHQRAVALRYVAVSLWVTLCAGASYGQPGATAVPVGVEAIRSMLTGHKHWTFYWDRAPLSRPHLGSSAADRSPSATFEFMRIGRRVIGHAQDDRVHHTECEFDVTVNEDGFTFAGCWGSAKSMTYDPDDREYPFKGRTDGTLLWLAPS